MREENIVFFDGICPLCNFLVRFVLKIDKKRQLSFSPLQGETFKRLLPGQNLHLKTIVFYQNQKSFSHSEAIIRILATSNLFFKFLLLFLLIPRFIRDLLYRSISRVRYKLFGKYEKCMIPDRKIKERFLP